MWNNRKSVVLSLVLIWVIAILIVLLAIGLPLMNKEGILYQTPHLVESFPVLYICIIPSFIALFVLAKLLINIKKEEVFIDINIKYLRIISWLCFVFSIIFLIALYLHYFYFMLAIFSAFAGLILRVVKNVFAKAVEIKNENDHTI